MFIRKSTYNKLLKDLIKSEDKILELQAKVISLNGRLEDANRKFERADKLLTEETLRREELEKLVEATKNRSKTRARKNEKI